LVEEFCKQRGVEDASGKLTSAEHLNEYLASHPLLVKLDGKTMSKIYIVIVNGTLKSV
jgi:hypothetical protein